jgi:hypothetical protein
MAFGSNSKIFRAGLADSLGNVAAIDLDADTLRAALYGNTGTPDQDATAANSAYAVGAWVTGNEVSQVGQWAVAGIALSSVVLDRATAATVFLDAADTASGSAATLANVYGCLVYDDTLTTPVADQGICYNSFGGAQSVTTGTFTVIWHSNGILRYSI